MDYKESLNKLQKIGYSLSSEKDIDALLHIILREAREMLSCDSGTLYIRKTLEDGRDVMEFSDVQNDSLEVSLRKATMPVASGTIPGHAASTGETVVVGDAYAIPRGKPYSFSHEFDKKTGYRTVSILAIPMKDRDGRAIGVITLYNKKRDFSAKLKLPKDFFTQVVPFTEDEVELAGSIASQAAIAFENALLYQEIKRLFEGFVDAAVAAVESRDPATAGHSGRVAAMTVELASRVNEVADGPWSDIRFSRKQLTELRYAGLLHDFGKIGVREHILLKQKKLYRREFELVTARFKLLKEQARRRSAEARLQHALEKGTDNYQKTLPEFDRELEEELSVLDGYLDFITRVNDPHVMKTDLGAQGLLDEIAAKKYRDEDGTEQPYLLPFEHKNLSLMKGSLNDEEREEVQSHVMHSYNFLRRIPWTRDFGSVADIAYTHHEKLNGKGYPRGIGEGDIPPQGKMMIIADIFDALTASDRPYKDSVGIARALKILDMEKNDGAIDPDLLNIFVEGKVWEVLTK